MELKILIIISSIINFLFGLLVYRKNPKDKVHQSFAGFSWGLALWALTFYFYFYPIFFPQLIWMKLVFFMTFPMIISILYFSSIFPTRQIKNFNLPAIIFILSSLIMIWLLFFTDLWVMSIKKEVWGPQAVTGRGYFYYFIYIVSWGGFIFYNLAREYYLADTDLKKIQIKYIFLGLFLFGIPCLILDIIFPLIFRTSYYFWVTPIFSLSFVSFTAFAILKYHLFEIRVILTEMLVGLMGLILVSEIFIFESLQTKILGLVVLLAYCLFGYLLIKATHQEIRRREQVEELARRLEDANVQVRSVEKVKSDLLNMASHEFRTPIGVIKNALWFLNKDEATGQISDKGKVNLERLTKATERLDYVLENMSELLATTSGELKLEITPTQLEILINDVVEAKTVEASEKRVMLEFKEPETPLPQISADPTKLKYVFWELITNALKYTNVGGQVTISAYKKDSSLEIKVVDTGRGIPKEQLGSLFGQPFTKMDFFHTTQAGMGLGLYIVKRIVDLHKGSIIIDSEEGQGTTVTITLPVVEFDGSVEPTSVTSTAGAHIRHPGVITQG